MTEGNLFSPVVSSIVRTIVSVATPVPVMWLSLSIRVWSRSSGLILGLSLAVVVTIVVRSVVSSIS